MKKGNAVTTVYTRQKSAREELGKIWESPQHALVVHYSCESFYDRPDGSSPRVTAIAVRNLKSGQTDDFSIHKCGERAGKKPHELEPEYNTFEKQMLEEFFSFVAQHKNVRWVHWNMRDSNYGFQALEHRLKVLGGTVAVNVHDEQKFDLSRILIGIYGKTYIEHAENGRLHSLMVLNNVSSRNFQTGKVEAELFSNHQYVALHQSTLAKTDVIANICQLTWEGNLKTKTTFLQMHTPALISAFHWIMENRLIKFILKIRTIHGFFSWFYSKLLR